MAFDWQNLVALTMVLAAGTHLVHRAWQTFAPRREVGGCGHCATCPSKSLKYGEDKLALARIDPPTARATRDENV